MEQGSRTKLVAALVLALVFASGILIGYAADGGAAVAMTVEPTGGEVPVPARRPYVPQYESMNPTLAQRTVIDSIMSAQRTKMNLLHEEFDVAQQIYQTSYDALIQRTRDAIALVFPEERRAEYRRRLEENDRQRAQERALQGDDR
jgi:hypothetical protein